MRKKVAVVILNWNGREYLEKFLPNVIEFSKDVADVIVADNDSTDDSVEFLKSNFPEVEIIINDTNGGFAKGYNDALAKVDAEYYVLLNSDIEVTKDWIKPVIQLMESDSKIAACQPKILSYYEKNKFEYAGAAGGFIDKYGYPFCRGRIFQTIEEDKGQYDDQTEIFWATGACMFVKSNLYKEFLGLDNDFFAHMEEIDFCWRLKNSGYKIYYVPDSTVYHIGGGTLPKKSSRKTYLNFRNNLILLYKNLPSNKLFIVFFARIMLDLIAAAKFVISGGINDMMAVFKAHIHFYQNISKHKLKRKEYKHNKVSKVFIGNIVIEYYLKRKKIFSMYKSKRFN